MAKKIYEDGMVRRLKTKAWVTAGLMLLMSAPVIAAGLGRLTVTSSLGQPFRGEIDLLAVDKKDLGSIRAGLPGPDAFREAKIDYMPALSAMRFSVEQKKNGDAYIRIVSTKPINDPFLDMLIELDWPSGRLVREYTVLLDPPGYGEPQAAAAPIALPVTQPAPAAKVEPPAAKTAEIQAGVQKPELKAGAAPETTAAKKTTEGARAARKTYGPVRKGENLAGIAATLKHGDVSLEQMLVALFRSNKKAFEGSNMNRLKAGQILHVPETGRVVAVERDDAAREVKVHAADWKSYRQKLAAAVAEAKPAPEESARPADGGKIAAAVEDKAAKEPAKDVLKLSRSEAQGGVKPGATATGAGTGGREMQGLKDQIHAMQEESTAREKAINDANQRIAELEKSIKEMQRLLELKNQSLSDLQKQAISAKTAPVEAQPAQPEAKPAEQKPPVAAKPVKPRPAPAQPKQPEPSLLDEAMGNPLYLGGGAAVILLLGLLGAKAVAAQRRKKAVSFEEGIVTGADLKASTALLGSASDTSFLTDFSQAGLGAIDTNEVDPIAEAEVYMAYGRDAQAEEILKEALSKYPSRHEIRLKLLEIHAGRSDLNAFAAVAGEIYAALGEQGSPIWDKAAEMGRALDPDNPLYGEKAKAPSAISETVVIEGGTESAESEVSAPEVAVPEAEVKPDVTPEAEPTPDEGEETAADLGFNLDLGALAGAEAPAEPVAAEEQAEPAADTVLDFKLDLDAKADEIPEAEIEDEQEGVMEFDLSALSNPAPKVAEAARKEEVAVEPAPAPTPDVEPISADSWKDEVMSLEFGAGGLPATEPEEVAAGNEMAEAGGGKETAAPELTDLSGGEEAAVASEAMESIELAAPPVAESPLDFDFKLGQEEEAPTPPPAEAKEAPVPDLDLSGISLEMDEPAPARTTPVDQAAEDFGSQDAATKLDLARAYMDMGDKEGARDILQEVLAEGVTEQQEEARKLLAELD